LCGLGHYKMRATMIVMNEPDFEKWLQQQEAANQ
jgi:heme/copper-type cytochrome/quinol oxidase subunit 2